MALISPSFGDFDFATAIVLRDDRKDYGEDRFRAYGTIRERLHALVFTATRRKSSRYFATQE
jgi:uncharacterized DUF497 family protein